MSNLSVKSVTNRHGFVVTLEETGKGHIKVWGNGVTLAQEQTIELRDWLNERYPTQPAAGEPEQQTAINADDLPTKKYPLGALDFAAPVAAGEPIQVEAVAVTREDEDGLYLDWVLEGGISALEAPGVVLLVAHGAVTDDQGSGEVYLAPPAAAHGDELVAVVGTVPDGSGFKSLDFKVALESLPDGTRLFAMRAQAGEGGEV